MGLLGDFFPESIKNDSAQRQASVRTVIKTNVDGIDHPKIFIIIGEDEKNYSLASVYINSEINPNVFRTEALKQLNVPIEKNSSRPYIDYDCYVDCSKLKFWEKTEIEKSILNNPDCVVGEITEEDYKSFTEKIKNAKTINNYDKKRIGLIS